MFDPVGGYEYFVFQHTAARRRLECNKENPNPELLFQHTAARRRLAQLERDFAACFWFQHTAARRRLVFSSVYLRPVRLCFNTQPPEGGWRFQTFWFPLRFVSTHSRPKATGNRCGQMRLLCWHVSTHSRPKAAGSLRWQKKFLTN